MQIWKFLFPINADYFQKNSNFVQRYLYTVKKIPILFILILQFWTLGATGYYTKNIGLENGISQSAVTSVVYDGRGGLWIGTRFGLNEYRNGELRTFLDDGTGRIEGNYVYFLFTDSRGQLWTSTDKGLFRYDVSRDSFVKISESQATCALEDENGIWFGGHFGPLYLSFTDGSISGGDSDVYTDYQTLFTYNGELYTLDKREGPVRNNDGKKLLIPELEGSLIMASALDGSTLYISILGYGLVAYDLSSESLLFRIPKGNGMPDEPLLALTIADGVLWMGFDGSGVQLMDLKNHSISQLGDSPQEVSGHIPPSVTALYRDPHDNMWIGSVRSGLVGLKPSPIKTFSLTEVDPNAENVIISVLSSSDGNVYLGTDGSGVCRYSPSRGLEFAPGQAGLKVTSIVDFDQNTLILATYNRGFFLMDRSTMRLRPFTLVDRRTNAEECFNSNSPTINTLPDGRILLLAVNTYLFDKRTWRFQAIPNETDGYGSELIVIGSAGSGTSYAYSSEGLYTIDLNDPAIRIIYHSGVETGNVNTAVYYGGLIWFGTNYGLFTFDPRTSQVTKVKTSLFSRVSRLETNGADNLWIAADNTLFLSRNGLIEMTGENRGVPANEILSSARTPDGTVYLGGTAGLLEIGADCYFSLDKEKQVELRDEEQSSIRLPHDYSSLTLSFYLSGADPFERVMYRYALSGTTSLTIETFEDIFSLPALKPGRYILNVSYLKSDGSWSTPGKMSEIRVMQPWYRSNSALIIYLVISLLAVAFLIERVSRRRIRELEAQLRERDSIFTGKVEAYIAEHLSDSQLSVADIADHMAMSRSTLYYKMSTSYGKGVAEVIDEMRMRKAEELLTGTSLSVLEISEKAGYSTPRYFSTRFKSLHDGVTPLRFRQLRSKM
jgi:AraC-like DNA-binding protein